MADRDVLELANDEEFGDGGMDDMENEVPEYELFSLLHRMDDNKVLHFLVQYDNGMVKVLRVDPSNEMGE